MEKLGFIGLGIMGMPMARHLCEAGNEVWVNDVNSAACEAAQKFGARPAPGGRDRGCVRCCVHDPAERRYRPAGAV